MPSRITPVMPGRRTSASSITMSQIDVPTTETSTPGSTTPQPGTETKESTLPTATATAPLSPSSAARQGWRSPAEVPSAEKSLPSFELGSQKPGDTAAKYAAGG